MGTIVYDESQNIEYKELWHDEYLKWICGFVNAQGGKIYIGVNDDREIVGVDDSKKLMEDMPISYQGKYHYRSGGTLVTINRPVGNPYKDEQTTGVSDQNVVKDVVKEYDRDIAYLQNHDIIKREGGRKEGRWIILTNPQGGLNLWNYRKYSSTHTCVGDNRIKHKHRN